MDQNQLVATIRNLDESLQRRNRATEILLAKVGGDKAKFVELIKGR
jgi:hypothetical protein